MSAILLTNSAAVSAGISRHKLAGPKFRRVLHGVHTAVDADLDFASRCKAALLVIPDGAAFSHWTAVGLMGGPVMNGPSWLEIIEPSTNRTRRPEVKGRRRVLADNDVVRRGEFLITSPLRTFIDLGESTSLPDLVALGDWLLHRGFITAPSLELGLCAASKQRGIVGARAAAKRLDGRAESPPESRLRLMLVDAGLPMPLVNVAVFDDDGGYIARPDLSYAKAKIAIEYEGAHHLDPRQFRRDTVRDQLLAALGWIVIRVTARDLRSGSSTFIDTITALLAARG